MWFISAAAVAVFVLIHLFGGRLQFLNRVPRSWILSMAGGVSVTFVFLHLLPELEKARLALDDNVNSFHWFENHAYLMTLCGLVLFYGLERRVRASQGEQAKNRTEEQTEGSTSHGVFWLRLVAFALYVGLISCLLTQRAGQDIGDLALYVVAMGLHFIANDFSLRQDHKGVYHRFGRWILAGAAVAGWLIGISVTVGETTTSALFAFLAGAIILNVLKEELPENRKSRFLPFAAGAGLYTLLLLLLAAS